MVERGNMLRSTYIHQQLLEIFKFGFRIQFPYHEAIDKATEKIKLATNLEKEAIPDVLLGLIRKIHHVMFEISHPYMIPCELRGNHLLTAMRKDIAQQD